MSNTTLTPLMQQYLDVKRQQPDSILLFRVGDFYELFFEDAETAAKVFGITLTTRWITGDGGPVAAYMTGFPHHALKGYLQKLVSAGHRVAICEPVTEVSP